MARPRKRDATELSDYLDALLERAGLTHNAFSAALGQGASSLSDRKLRANHRRSERDDREDVGLADRCAKVLRLTRPERDTLFRLLQESRAPRSVRDRLAQLERDAARPRVAEADDAPSDETHRG